MPTNLISPITESTIIDAVEIDKKTLNYLQNLDEAELQKISRIRFAFNRREYYDSYVVREYFRRLNNLK